MDCEGWRLEMLLLTNMRASRRRHTTYGATASGSSCALLACLSTCEQHTVGAVLGEPRGNVSHGHVGA
jgi:hypothetical protein